MATTSPNANLVRAAWAKKLWVDAQDEQFFVKHGFIGESDNSIIVKKVDLKKDKGDTIHIGLSVKLSGSGISGDSTLEGYEEAISTYAMDVQLDQIRNAVRIAGALAEQQACYDMRSDAKEKLKIWLAEYLDEKMFEDLASSPSTNRKIWCSVDHSSVATLDTTDKLSTGYISEAKRLAKLASPRVRPIRVNGKEHYVLVVHPYCMRDLRRDADWIDAQQLANVRGVDNPIFSGAEGMWDGVIIYEHENVYRTNDGSSSAYIARNLLLGAGAGVWAIGKEPFWREKTFDYENQVGFATGLIHGFKKAVFDGEDYGVVTLYASAASD